MPSTWTMTTSHSKAGVTGNLYIADSSQKLPAANDNVQNHTHVTEVVELVSLPIRDSKKSQLNSKQTPKLRGNNYLPTGLTFANYVLIIKIESWYRFYGEFE